MLSGVKPPLGLSLGMLRRNETWPSANRKFEPPKCRLEESSSPPSVSVVVLLRWLWASTRVAAGDQAEYTPGHGFCWPRKHTAPGTAPAQMPFAKDQARSPTRMVELVPSLISIMRVRLLR